MKWQDFVAINEGTRIHNHDFDQCVALVNLYHEDVIGGVFVPVSSAYQWWNDWAEVAKRYTRSQTPVAGAIVIWGTTWGSAHGRIGLTPVVPRSGRLLSLDRTHSCVRVPML